jgi:alginate O-acetyltransferase complex protein AlgJ
MMTSERHYFSSAEKRKLSEPPEIKLDWQNIQEFFPKFEAFFNDHFGYRENYIQKYNRILDKYFGKSPVPDVLFGKDGWLFVTKGKIIEDFLGFKPLSPEELKAIGENLRNKQQWLASKGIQYLFVVVPGKQTVYPEYLPDYISSRRGRSRIDQVVDYHESQPDLNFLDLRPTLLTAKSRHRIYHMTDSHWNIRGAYAGYLKIMEQIQRLLPQANLVLNDYHESGTRAEEGGDLAVMIKKEKSLREMTPILEKDQKCAIPKAISISAWDTSEVWWKAFITECPTGSLRAIVFRDSMSTLLVPFMADHFEKAFFFWKDYDHEIVKELLTTFKPDIVIEEMGERKSFRAATKKLVLD